MSRRAVPDLDPKTWHAHPRWRPQAYDALVGFHDRYRRETSRLVAAAQDDAVSPAELRRACTQLEEHLHSHEAVEEQALYPWIEVRYEVDLGELRQQHAALDRTLERAIAGLAEPIDRPALRACLVGLDQALREHLAAEEAVCVPPLLDMSAEAFAALTTPP